MSDEKGLSGKMSAEDKVQKGADTADGAKDKTAEKTPTADMPKEIGGRGGLEPTRYGDWEKDGIISDF